MGFALAIKRSYRYFVPHMFQSPRNYVRTLYPACFIYVVGLYTGLYIHSADPVRITSSYLAVMVVLIAIKWWAEASATIPEA